MGLAFDSFRRLPLVFDAERATENGPSTGGELGRHFIGCDGGTLHPVAYDQVIPATLVPGRLSYFPGAEVRIRSTRCPTNSVASFIFLGCTINLRIAPYIRLITGLGSLGAGG
jgi:hypothetical protein